MDSYIEHEKLKLKSVLNAFLATGFGVMLLVNLGLGAAIYNMSMYKSRTLLPPLISKAFTVSDWAVDEAYLEQMAEYFLALKLNVTPASVDRKHSRLLSYVSAKDWPTIQPALTREATTIKQGNISSNFDIEHIEVSMESMKVRLTGTLQKHVAMRALKPETATYQVSMSYPSEITILTIQKVEPIS